MRKVFLVFGNQLFPTSQLRGHRAALNRRAAEFLRSKTDSIGEVA